MKRCFHCGRQLEPGKHFCPHCMTRQSPVSPKRNRSFIRLFWKPGAILAAALLLVMIARLFSLNETKSPPAIADASATASPAPTVSYGSTAGHAAATETHPEAHPIATVPLSGSTAAETRFPETTRAPTTPTSLETAPVQHQAPMEEIRRRVQSKLDFDIRQITVSDGLVESGTWYNPYEDMEILVNRLVEILKMEYINAVPQIPMVYYLRLGEDSYGSPYIYAGTGYVNAPLKNEAFDSQTCIREVITNIQQLKPEHRFLEVPYPYITSFITLTFSCPTSWTQEEIAKAYANYLSGISFSEELYIVYLGTRSITNGITGITEEQHVFGSPVYGG